jgi:sugar-specific transcriptional regulator TrmB
MFNDIENTLALFGLSYKEISAYLWLLKTGSSQASSLSSRLLIPRSTAQYVCQSLLKKGFVKSIVRNNTIIYSAEDPNKLSVLLKEAKNKISEKELKLNQILGSLKNLQNPNFLIPKVRFFQGVDEIISLFKDVLKSKPDKIYGIISASSNANLEVLDFLKNDYIKQRSIDTKAFAISSQEAHTENILTTNTRNRFTVYLNPNDFNFNTNIQIYNGKVAFYSINSDDLTGVLIENENIFKTQFSLFKTTWNYAISLDENKNLLDVEL